MGRPRGSTNKKTVAAAETAVETAPTPKIAQPKSASMTSPVKPPKPVKIDTAKTNAQRNIEEENDMLYIPPEIIPDGMRYNWKTLSVLGQQQNRRFGRFQMTGWTPVPAERHPGMFTPAGYKGEIEYDGLVLMEKSEALCRETEAREYHKARSQVQAKEQQLRGGDVGVTQGMSPQRGNLSKSYERLDVPKE